MFQRQVYLRSTSMQSTSKCFSFPMQPYLSRLRRLRNSANSPETPLGPLHGIRIMDLTRILAAPYCTQILADLGAEVIKIEHPERGDDTRAWGPPFVGDDGAYFMMANRNKKSVCLDLKHPQGLQIAKKIASKVDVLVENFIPGKLDAMGLGYKALSMENPGLIYASLSAFGASGPYAHKAGYDVMVSALGGLMGITGSEDSGPVKVGVAVTDLLSGLFLHGAILAALLARQQCPSGKGQLIETSLLECQVAALLNIGQNYLSAGVEGKRWGTAHESIVPYRAFPTKDGFVVVGAMNQRQWEKLCDALDLDHLVRDPKFAENRYRVANRKELEEMHLLPRFAKEPTAEWLDILEKHGVPCAPVNSIGQVLKDPQVRHREMIKEMPFNPPKQRPEFGQEKMLQQAGSAIRSENDSTLKLLGFPVKYSDTPATLRSPPPLLGQHTSDVLREMIGLTADEVDQLLQEKVIFQGHQPH